MGVVTDHIKNKLINDVREKGLLVWLDKDSEFTSLVDKWISEKDGSFPYNLFAFRGSFLELMIQSKEVLSRRDKPKCVIHMPGFNEQEIKETPILEAYKAGQRWRISRETMIKEAAQGRLTEEQTRYLLSQDNLDLFLADSHILEEEKVPEEVKTLLKKYGEIDFVLKFVINPELVKNELCVSNLDCFKIMKSYLKTLVGIDEKWQERWNHFDSENKEREYYLKLNNQADLFISFIMAMEFVGDLNVKPSSERLSRLKSKSTQFFNKSKEILKRLREQNPHEYKKWAEIVESNLTEEECSYDSKDLGQLDTFKFEADSFLNNAMYLLKQNNYLEALDLALTRLPGKNKNIAHTFWLKQDPKRLWLWKWIEITSKLGLELEKIDIKLNSLNKDNLTLEKLTDIYCGSSGWWVADNLHRKFVSSSERYLSTDSNLHIKTFIDIRIAMNFKYRNCIDEQSLLWNKICEDRGFLPSKRYQQREFFNTWVKPIIDKKKKTAIILVDALRYELSQELLEELKNICSIPKIDSMLSELPSITSVGMNALMPVVNNSELQPLFDKKNTIIGFKGGERQVKGPKERKKTVEEYTGIVTSWLSLTDMLKLSDKDLKKKVSNNLSVITALDIDKMGESGAQDFGINYFETGIARLKTAVIRLKENGVEEFIITSDHGFILGDESMKTNVSPKLDNVDRRHAYDMARSSEELISVDPLKLNYAVDSTERHFVFNRTTHILNSSNKTFYHGGNSIQERLVPVIQFSFKNDLADATGNYDVEITKKANMMGFNRAAIIVKPMSELLLDIFSLSEIDVQLLSDDDIRVEIQDITIGKRTGDVLTIPVDKEIEILFKLSGGSSSKAQIGLNPTLKGTRINKVINESYFNVESSFSSRNNSTPSTESQDRDVTDKTLSKEIPEEYHTALMHLNKHGSLTETFLVNTLGGDRIASRKARRFASRIDEWLKYLSFDIIIENTSEGIVYRTK